MPIEAATYISTLNASNPPSTDLLAEGDDHLRLLKSVLLASFPNITGAMTATHTVLNGIDGRVTTAEGSITTLLASFGALSNDFKQACLVASTSNIVSLSGEQTIDGVLTSGSRVLVRAQTAASANGIYVTSVGAWSRSTDFDATSEITGAIVAVEQGTLFADTVWMCSNDSSAIINTTAISFNQIDGLWTTNAQVGTTYTFLASDKLTFVTTSNAATIAGTLPQATTSGFGLGFVTFVKNIGAGTLTITPTTSTVGTGTALVLRTNEWAILWSDGTNYDAIHTGRITGASSVREVGTRGAAVQIQDAAYQFAFGDEGSVVRHTSATPHTYTVPSNAGTAFPVGTIITVVNEPAGGTVSIVITTDTLNRGDGVAGTGTRTVPANSVVSLIKTSATTWIITGNFT